MRQACINFQKKIKNYFAYQARQNYLRQQMSVYGELDATKLREQQALAREQQVVAERDALALREQQALAESDAAAFKAQQALEEIEKLKALLAEKKS